MHQPTAAAVHSYVKFFGMAKPHPRKGVEPRGARALRTRRQTRLPFPLGYLLEPRDSRAFRRPIA